MLLDSLRNAFHKTILFLYIAMLLFNFWFPLRNFKDQPTTLPQAEPAPSSTMSETFPDLWDHGIQGFLFLLGILIAPRTTLIFFASIPWNVWFVIGVFFFPEYTLIFLAFSRGYHHSNYLLLAMYCLWKLWAIHVIQGAQDSQEQRGEFPPLPPMPSLLESFVRTLRPVESLQMWAAAQEAINILKRQRNQLQQRVSLLELDPSMLRKLTTNQLNQLHDQMKYRLQSLETMISTRIPNNATPSSSSDMNNKEPCVVCLTNETAVRLDPCGHQCLCEVCWDEWQSRSENTCPLCRMSILSHSYEYKSFVPRISMEEYHRQGVYHTSMELAKLYSSVRKDPSLLQRLEKCDVKQFEDFM